MSRRDELVAELEKHRAEMQRISAEELVRAYSDYWLREFDGVVHKAWSAQYAIDKYDEAEGVKATERDRVLSRINLVLREPYADKRAMELAVRAEMDALWNGT